MLALAEPFAHRVLAPSARLSLWTLERGVKVKVPLNWLREYCSPELDIAAIEERLTMTGTKVETILHHGVPSVEGFVVGRVLTVEPHPDADRLKVCTVDVGEHEPAGIVCGAPNVLPSRPLPWPCRARGCLTEPRSRPPSCAVCPPTA